MNKKVIWLIIGLMTIAMIGSIIVQYQSISFTVRLNEAQFNDKVKIAMSDVSKRLEIEEERKARSTSRSGYQSNFFSEYYKDANLLLPEITATFEEFHQETDATIRLMEVLSNPCSCPNCQREKQLAQVEIQSSSASFGDYKFDFLSLADRLSDMEKLDQIIAEELIAHGVELDYKYGVFSRAENGIVIADNHYTVTNDDPDFIIPGSKNLWSSIHKINLFSTDRNGSPGFLSLYFPRKSNFILTQGQVLVPLIGAILFSAIILFCFLYTINVIFFQKKLSEMKTDFINNMTHEFKTPIATISLAADSINSPKIAGNAEKVQRFARIIKEENKRMNSQVEKVLQMAMLDSQEFSLKLSEVNLHDVINTAIRNINLKVEQRGGEAWAELNAETSSIEGDLTHVSNIINNLLDNANKYSPESPEITVHTRNTSSGVEVTISDKGMGMTKEARKHIFDKFYRVHTGDVHDIKGHGLGLSYVKAMMTAHKGSIDVKSELGKGSSFILVFPFRVGQKVMH